MNRRFTWVAAAVGVSALGLAAAPSFGSSNPALHFAKPVFVDQQLAGGEPMIFWDPRHQDYIYTSHEGTTHTFHDGVVEAPVETTEWAANYRNQVNIWTSRDGVHWTRVNLDGSGFEASPASNTGFSDPDLTQDAGGRVYNTGIDLVNDALFSSGDGGRTWDRGTVNCHDGDRPWLAGGPKNTVWLATDPSSGSHTVYISTDGGNSCDQTGIADPGAYGKLIYDSIKGSKLYGALIEPVPGRGSVGISVLPNAVKAFKTHSGHFTKHTAVFGTDSSLSISPILSLDTAGNLYEVWADEPGGTTGNGKNTVWLTMSRDGGKTWAKPYVVAHPGTTVLWPWVAAGKPGNVAVVWYQYDRPTPNPDQATTGKVSVMAATIFGFGTRHVTKHVANAAGRPIHEGGICQSGTACVATGQDRRLGDYFTDGIDSNGCLIIATGDTTQPDPVTGKSRAWSLPLFIRQDGGRSVTGKSCGHSRAGHAVAVGRGLSRVGPLAAGLGDRAALLLLGMLGLLAAARTARRSRLLLA